MVPVQKEQNLLSARLFLETSKRFLLKYIGIRTVDESPPLLLIPRLSPQELQFSLSYCILGYIGYDRSHCKLHLVHLPVHRDLADRCILVFNSCFQTADSFHPYFAPKTFVIKPLNASSYSCGLTSLPGIEGISSPLLANSLPTDSSVSRSFELLI